MTSRVLLDIGYPENCKYRDAFLLSAKNCEAEIFSSGQGFGTIDYGFIFPSENKANQFLNKCFHLYPESWVFWMSEID